jgi:hypothetical protein
MGGAALAALFLAAGTTAARAQSGQANVRDIQSGLPLQVEGAGVLPLRDVRLEGMIGYERTRGDRDAITLSPRYRVGLTPQIEGSIAGRFLEGSGSSRNSGDTLVRAKYQVYETLPGQTGLALIGGLDLPSGRQSLGLDPSLMLAATHRLADTDTDPSLHANLGIRWNSARRAGENKSGHIFVVGYSVAPNERNVWLLDYVNEKDPRAGVTTHMLEAGLRRQHTERLVWSAGVGFGLNDNSPRVRLVGGVQFAL